MFNSKYFIKLSPKDFSKTTSDLTIHLTEIINFFEKNEKIFFWYATNLNFQNDSFKLIGDNKNLQVPMKLR